MTTKTNGESAAALKSAKQAIAAKDASAKTAPAESGEPVVAEKSTRAARMAGGEAGRKQKEIYRQVKAYALEREKANYSKLFLIHEKNNWWKMIGHSAVLFHYEISHWIDMSSRLQPDSDYNSRSEEGVVNIHDIVLLDQKLAKAKIDALDINEHYRVYNIGRKFTDADINAFVKSRELEWAKINSVIQPKEIFPDLAASLRLLVSKIYFSTRILEPMVRDMTGKIMLERTADLLCEYSRLANGGGLSDTDFLARVDDAMTEVIARMAIVADLRVMQPKAIYQILQAATKVKRDLARCRPKKL